MPVNTTRFLREETNACTIERWKRREGVTRLIVIRYTRTHTVILWQ